MSVPAQDGDVVSIGLLDFAGPADDGDASVLDRSTGPVLDVGCGPARMVHALIRRGVHALGVDLAAAAVARGRAKGAPVLRRDVFARLPGEGMWATALLVDGNIGIGGDPARLLARCADLLRADGRVLVELDPDPEIDVRCTAVVTDTDGHVREHAWARVGADAVRDHAQAAGLAMGQTWWCGDRCFAELTVDACGRGARRSEASSG